ncbi:MAG TPA: right-handed parallel beta-helix repeat-containing protein [Terracidiphilus sp.]|nr:right-handed parallel beta-helix repeat-containing protein [Terracidiphilus sp.]
MADSHVDWFVAEGSVSGDGSRERPFHDLWLALRSAGPGDVIHIAAGTYYGRYDRSSWEIDCPNLEIRGGYSHDFLRRTPWQTPCVFAAYAGYEATRENNLVSGRDDHSGLVLDGLFFDASGRNSYGDEPVEELRSYPQMDGPIASFNGKQVTIKNCVFANSTAGGVEMSGDGSRFENNIVINTVGLGMLDLRSAMEQSQPITVVSNTFCFAHDPGPPSGTGVDQAIGVRVNRPCVIQDNIFISCGNAAISLYRDPDRVSVDRNLFFLTPRDIAISRAGGSTADITEANIDELEDLGFKSASANIVQDAGISGLKKDWLDAYTRHLLANYVKPPYPAANLVRKTAGLSELAPTDFQKEEDKGAFAPRMTPADVLELRMNAKQGVHPSELKVDIGPPPAREVRTYRSIGWEVIDSPDHSLANQRVELHVGLGYEQNASLLSDATPETHMGIRVYRPGTDDGSIFVLAKRHTLPTRQFEDAIKSNNGREVEITYLIRGIYRTDVDPPTSRQKVTIIVEFIAPGPAFAPALPERPKGRDWFVRAGATGGDGSREKPFRDPFQALEKAEGGDSIHVTTGAYVGKLRSGKWKILVRNLTMLGGYDADFASRDPWINPTRFVLDADERAKGIPDGTILGSEENSDGLVLDGFIFDGATYNAYTKTGALDVANSPSASLVDLRGGRAPVTVRNCVFLNASGTAINIACPSGVFENNLLLNTSGSSLKIRADGPGPWTVRNNTLLFACDPTARAGTGQSSSEGTLFQLNGRAVAEVNSNIFAFADNFGVCSTITQSNLSYDRNVFAAILHIYLTDTQYLWADRASWERRAVADSSFASCGGNTLQLPKLSVDPAFADAALTRLFALQSRISAEEWKAVASQIGATVQPPSANTTPVQETAKPAPTTSSGSGPSSLNDLLASLSSMKTQIKEIASTKPAAIVDPVYCPASGWQKALALVQDGAAGQGARRIKLTVTFSDPAARPTLSYTPVNVQTIDADHTALDNKPVDVVVTEARASAGNLSGFPSGVNADDYAGYSVSTPGDATRTRLIILVRLDTAASKLLDRTVPTDKLRIRGIALIPADPNALSIVVDSAEGVEN